jgi:hypothetical protein
LHNYSEWTADRKLGVLVDEQCLFGRSTSNARGLTGKTKNLNIKLRKPDTIMITKTKKIKINRKNSRTRRGIKGKKVTLPQIQNSNNSMEQSPS